jgi:hypothetical protein
MSKEWTTRVDPKYTRQFGVEELHKVYFEPSGWPGKGTSICFLIPECELQVTFLDKDGELIATVNRPPHNRKLKYWLHYVCELATEQCAFLIFTCDTAEQAQHVAKVIAKRLPQHRRAAVERVDEFQARDQLS